MAAITNFDQERQRNYDILEQLLRDYKEMKKASEIPKPVPEPDEELNPNIIGCCWFSGRSTVCVVIVYSEHEDTGLTDEDGKPVYGGPKAYIGSVKGISEEHDMNETANWGAKFPVHMAEQLITMYGGWLKPQKMAWRPKAETNSPLKLKLKYKGNDKS